MSIYCLSQNINLLFDIWVLKLYSLGLGWTDLFSNYLVFLCIRGKANIKISSVCIRIDTNEWENLPSEREIFESLTILKENLETEKSCSVFLYHFNVF